MGFYYETPEGKKVWISKVEDVKNYPKLESTLRKYFVYLTRQELQQEQEKHKKRLQEAQLQIAELLEQRRVFEEKRVADLQKQATLLESRTAKARQQLRQPEKIMGEARLLSDQEVSQIYNRLNG